MTTPRWIWLLLPATALTSSLSFAQQAGAPSFTLAIQKQLEQQRTLEQRRAMEQGQQNMAAMSKPAPPPPPAQAQPRRPMFQFGGAAPQR
jgi:hypothetical protein